MTVSSKRVEFTGGGGESLAARLDLPDAKPLAFALFAHCFTCSKDILAASRISASLATRGIAVLRFDFTGLGSSEGEFANTGFRSNVEDLVAAAGFLRETYQAPRILIGHSLGGTAVLAAAAQIPEAVAVATVGAPFDPAHVRHLIRDAVPEIEAAGAAEVEIAGRKFRIGKRFLNDLADHDMHKIIGHIGKALLILHAPGDRIVDIDNARLIFEAARHPKSFVSLDGADHLLTRAEDAAYVGILLAAWAARYTGTAKIGAVETGTAKPGTARAEALAAPGEPGLVVVGEAGDGRYAQRIDAAGHALRADEPASVGGDDTGPSPYDLLLAALGACTSMTLRMYADRKAWPLERVVVRLRHQKIHAADCETCETKEGKIDRIDRELTITGPLDDDQRARLVAIADKCPVHRTLHSENLIVTKLAD